MKSKYRCFVKIFLLISLELRNYNRTLLIKSNEYKSTTVKNGAPIGAGSGWGNFLKINNRVGVVIR